MTESNANKAKRELAEAQKIQTYINSVKDGIDTAVEQGLWIALMVDFAAISGKIYIKEDEFLYEQRWRLAETIDYITKKNIEAGDFLPAVIPNPGYYLFRYLRPLAIELKRKENDENGQYFRPLDPIPRMILIFVFPGILRLLAKQIGEILPL